MIASPIVGMKRMPPPKISGVAIGLLSSEDETQNNNAPSSRNQRARSGSTNSAFHGKTEMDMGGMMQSSKPPTFNQRDMLRQLGVTKEEHAMERHPACAHRDTPLSEDVLLQATTSTGPESEESAPLRHTLSALGIVNPPYLPYPM